MIIYFSSTGNSKYVASKIASATGDRLISVTDRTKDNNFEIKPDKDESIGFVSPTYFWGISQIVSDFLDKMNLTENGNHYVYNVLTFGTTTGAAQKLMVHKFQKKGINVQGKFAIKMVDTWTPMFDLSDKRKNMEVTKNADEFIDDIISKVQAKSIGDYNKDKAPSFIAGIVQKEYQTKRKTSNFTLSESCIGCGICEKQCPVSAIKVENRKAKWVMDKCVICLGCLHKCPNFAIQYGNKTQKHGQFVNPNINI